MDPMVLKALLDQARDEALEDAARIADEHAARGAAHWAGRAIRARKGSDPWGPMQHPVANPVAGAGGAPNGRSRNRRYILSKPLI